jgi:hypothetical protein
MDSVEELRAEARRLRDAANTISDLGTKKELTSRALELSRRAEALASGMIDPGILGANIERYRSLLASGSLGDEQKRIVEDLLAEAETLLAHPGKAPP